MPERQNQIISSKSIAILFLVTFFVVMLMGALMMMFVDQNVALLAEVFIIVPALVYVFYRRYSARKIFRLNAISFRMALLSFLVALSTIVLTDEMDRVINSIFPMPAWWQDAVRSVVEIQTLWDGVIIVGAAVLLAGLAEEMMFRGLLQRTLEYERDPLLAVVISAAFFALVHFNPWTALQITFLGLVLGYTSWKSKSIYPAVILHGLNNLLSVVVFNISDTQLSFYAGPVHVRYHWILLAVVIFIVSIWGFNRECERFHYNGGFGYGE